MNFERIYKEFFKRIYSYIISRTRNDAAAQDIAAAMWEKVFKKLDSFDADKGNISQWLFAVARNEVNMHYRLYHVRKFFNFSDYEDFNPPSGEKEAPELMEAELERQNLLKAMETLSGKERDILALKFYSGLNNREIAVIVNISESNAGTIINRSIAKLRVLLEAK